MAPSLWKIRREIHRLGVQLRELPADLQNYFIATGRYDRRLADGVRRHSGRQPESTRIAVFVIFPRDGVLPSHLRVLNYFSVKGYATLVVSNLPLSESDRVALLDRCWTLIERPNFGYDFGGYRDGVLYLAEMLPEMERLVLVNDSSWFPLPGARDWLDDAEALNVDFAGASSHFAVPRPEIENFRDLHWAYSPRHRNFHYGSFALCFRSSILRNPRFLRYWQRLRLADKKKQTVRRGEIGLTQWVLAEGYSHGATLDITHLDRDLNTLETGRLVDIVRTLIIPELPRLNAVVKRVLDETEPKRTDLVNLILLAVSRQGAGYALASYAIAERGFAFLKKSPVRLNEESARITLDLIGRLDGADEIMDEAQAIYDKAWGKVPVPAPGS